MIQSICPSLTDKKPSLMKIKQNSCCLLEVEHTEWNLSKRSNEGPLERVYWENTLDLEMQKKKNTKLVVFKLKHLNTIKYLTVNCLMTSLKFFTNSHSPWTILARVGLLLYKAASLDVVQIRQLQENFP